jgi:hypothetical protein
MFYLTKLAELDLIPIGSYSPFYTFDLSLLRLFR